MLQQTEVKPITLPTTPQVVYVVCVGRESQIGAMPTIQGLEPDQFATTLCSGGLAALVIDVAAEYFTGPQAERNLSDTSWLIPRAVRHEEMIRAAMQHGPVLPLPFGTIFSSRDALAPKMAAYAPLVDNFISRVEGCGEFALRIAYHPEVFHEAVLHELLRERPAPSSPGARYLFEKKLREEAGKLARARIESRTDQILETLRDRTRGIITRRAVTDRGDGLITASCHACLVVDEAADAFHKSVQALAAEQSLSGVQLDVTGPWPPYSFCPSIGDVR